MSKTLGVSSRSIEKDIGLLKKQKFIQFEGSRKTGKYKLTEKYKKLKDKLGMSLKYGQLLSIK